VARQRFTFSGAAVQRASCSRQHMVHAGLVGQCLPAAKPAPGCSTATSCKLHQQAHHRVSCLHLACILPARTCQARELPQCAPLTESQHVLTFVFRVPDGAGSGSRTGLGSAQQATGCEYGGRGSGCRRCPRCSILLAGCWAAGRVGRTCSRCRRAAPRCQAGSRRGWWH
jgi:hypothetical protein